MTEPKVKCINCSGKDCKFCGGIGEFVGIAISNTWPTIKSEKIKELEKEMREFEIPKPSVILQVGGKKPPGYQEPQSSAPSAPSTPTTSKMDENERDRLELARRSRLAPTPSIVCVTTPEFEAAELIALARSKPDEGAGGGDQQAAALARVRELEVERDDWKNKAFSMVHQRLAEKIIREHELNAAHRRVHGEGSEDCVFCNSKTRVPVNTGNQECPQCRLCMLEAEHDQLLAPDTGDDSLYNVRRLREELAQVKIEREKLQAWTNEQLLIEKEWDAQSLAEQLGAKMGESCRKVVAREVPKLIAQKDHFHSVLEQIKQSCPAIFSGICFYPMYDGDGEYIGEQYVDPVAVIGRVMELVDVALYYNDTLYNVDSKSCKWCGDKCQKHTAAGCKGPQGELSRIF